MPYRQITPQPQRPNHTTLVHSLAQELTLGPDDQRPAGAPVVEEAPNIIEEATSLGNLHVVVIWDAWGHVPPQERGKVIMEAYKTLPGDQFTRISIAMGLTPEEAERLGIG